MSLNCAHFLECKMEQTKKKNLADVPTAILEWLFILSNDPIYYFKKNLGELFKLYRLLFELNKIRLLLVS